MRKPVALLLLAIFSVPYARAPLCQLGSHDHEVEEAAGGHGDGTEGQRPEHTHAHGDGANEAPMEHAHRDGADEAPMEHAQGSSVVRWAPGLAVFTGIDAGPDCHRQMMCDAAVDQVVASPGGITDARLPFMRPRLLSATDVALVTLSIDLPPPRRA